MRPPPALGAARLRLGRRPLGMALVAAVVSLAARATTFGLSDLEVYRRGADQVLHGVGLYGPSTQLPFTYPPFAAIVFVPLDLMGRAGAIVAMTLLSLACYGVVVGVCARRLGFDRRATLIAGVAGLGIEPVVHTLALGQVNLVLQALVVVDLLLLPAGRRGWLVGVAAGLKLVPGVFVLYLLLKRDWWAVARAAAGMAVTITVGGLLDHGDTHLYWTKLFYDDQHVGGVPYVGNQSLNGVLSRWLQTETPSHAAYAACAVAALAAAVWAARRRLRSGDDVGAVVAIAFGGLLASPISWTHHFVWFVPALMVLWTQRHRVTASLFMATVLVAPMWYIPRTDDVEFHHDWWQRILCLSYTVLAIWLLGRLSVDPQPIEDATDLSSASIARA